MIPPFDSIVQVIQHYHRFLIISHVSPDGDALGSALGLSLALNSIGKEAAVVSRELLPMACRFLRYWDAPLSEPPAWGEYVLFILDCDGSPKRVAAPYSVVENAATTILIDHHRTSNPNFDINWIDSNKSATALMIYQLLQHLQIPLNKDIYESLACGLSTDTGHFRYSNTTPESLRAMADMLEAGVDNALISFKLFEEHSLDSVRLTGLALSQMHEENGGELMWTALSLDDYAKLGIGETSSEGLVNQLRNIRGARMAIVLREHREDDGTTATRVSVRSQHTLRADLFCAQFDGGGHAAAAGCRLADKPFENNVRKVIDAARVWVSGGAVKAIAAQQHSD